MAWHNNVPMPIFYNHPEQRIYRKQLRRAATPTEVMLWYHLRQRKLLGYKFRRQHSIGKYILTFYCPELRLAVEVDGGQHSESAIAKMDALRTAWLQHFRITVVRFTAAEVMNNRGGVLERLEEVIKDLETKTHHPRPPATPS